MYIIFALVDTVFCESSQPRSAQDKQRRAKKTFEEMMTYIPGMCVCTICRLTYCGHFQWIHKKFIHRLSLDVLGKCIGEDAKYEGVRLLFDGLQQPVLNKQVHTHTHTACITQSLSLQHVCISLLENLSGPTLIPELIAM